MKRLLILFLTMTLAFSLPAQTNRQPSKKKAKTTRVVKKRTAKKKKKTAGYSNSSIKGLRNQRAGVQRKIKQQEQLLRANKADVKKRLGSLMVISSEIDRHQKSIDTIQNEISHIDDNISMLRNQLATLEKQLDERKAKYVKSLRYLAGRRTVQDKLMFIFSAKNFAQMYRKRRTGSCSLYADIKTLCWTRAGASRRLCRASRMSRKGWWPRCKNSRKPYRT